MNNFLFYKNHIFLIFGRFIKKELTQNQFPDLKQHIITCATALHKTTENT